MLPASNRKSGTSAPNCDPIFVDVDPDQATAEFPADEQRLVTLAAACDEHPWLGIRRRPTGRFGRNAVRLRGFHRWTGYCSWLRAPSR